MAECQKCKAEMGAYRFKCQACGALQRELPPNQRPLQSAFFLRYWRQVLAIAFSVSLGAIISLHIIHRGTLSPGEVKSDFISYLRSLPGNPQATETADFLAARSVGFGFSNLAEAKALIGSGDSVDAIFDPGIGSIVLNPSLYGCVLQASGRIKCSDENYKKFIEKFYPRLMLSLFVVLCRILELG